MTLEEIRAFSEAGTLREHLLPLDMPLGHLPKISLPERMRKQAVNGMRFAAPDDIREGESVRTYLGDEFLGMTAREGQDMVWKVLIPPGE